jgi:hypothetical protein
MSYFDNKKIIRIDDIGASTKQFERHSTKFKGLINVGPLKNRQFFGDWGPYDEITPSILGEFIRFVKSDQFSNPVVILGITASYVNYDGSLITFDKYAPNLYKYILELEAMGNVVIGCHGLTHCVLKNKKFRPKFWGSNRIYHREFHDWLPRETLSNHLYMATSILRSIFKDVSVIIPPGNLLNQYTLDVAENLDYKFLSTEDNVINSLNLSKIQPIKNDTCLRIHDRELAIKLEDVMLDAKSFLVSEK